MNHQVHYKVAHQQSANVPADKMLSYIIHNSHLIAADVRYADKIVPTDRGSNLLKTAHERHAEKILRTDRGSYPVTAPHELYADKIVLIT